MLYMYIYVIYIIYTYKSNISIIYNLLAFNSPLFWTYVFPFGSCYA